MNKGTSTRKEGESGALFGLAHGVDPLCLVLDIVSAVFALAGTRAELTSSVAFAILLQTPVARFVQQVCD